jgi:hypothetical protein
MSDLCLSTDVDIQRLTASEWWALPTFEQLSAMDREFVDTFLTDEYERWELEYSRFILDDKDRVWVYDVFPVEQ